MADGPVSIRVTQLPMERARMEVCMVRPCDRKRVGDAATTTWGAERRGVPPSRHTFIPGDKMGEDGGGREALIGAG